MPQLHLTKVAFGCRDLDALRSRVVARAENGQLRVPTRMRPKRAAEAVGGNLYWIVKHRIVGGNRILAFEDRPDGRIDIVCASELEAVTPFPKRAHQAGAISRSTLRWPRTSSESGSCRRNSTDACRRSLWSDPGARSGRLSLRHDLVDDGFSLRKEGWVDDRA